MFKKIVYSLNEDEKKQKLIAFKTVEKVKKNSKIILDEFHKAIILRDNAMSEILYFGEFKPFQRADKKYDNILICFISMKKSNPIYFATRSSEIKDIKTGEINEIVFRGNYSYEIRNERKFMGTFIGTKKDITYTDFSSDIQMQVNSFILPTIVEFCTKNKISYNEFNANKNSIETHLTERLSDFLDKTYGVVCRGVNLDNI